MNGTAHIQAATGVAGYATLAEYLTAYEDEIVLRVALYMARHDKKGRKPKVDAETLAEKLEATEKKRLARTAATRTRVPLARVVTDWSLSRAEEALLAYLLFLREGVRLPAMLAEFATRDFGTARMALAIAVGEPGASYTHRQLLATDAPLMRADLVARVRLRESLSDVHLSLTPAATALLLDDDAAFSHLSRGITIERPTETLQDVVLVPDAREVIERSVLQHGAYLAARVQLETTVTYGTATILLFHGAPGTGKTLTARAIAGSLGRPLIVIDPAERDPWRDPSEILSIGMAEAQRSGGIVFIDEIEHIIARSEERRLLAFLESADTIVILATNNAQILSAALERRVLHKVHFPLPDTVLRRAIWKRHLPQLDDGVASQLAHRYWISGGYIKNAVLAAVEMASAEKLGEGLPHEAHLRAAAAEQARRFESALSGLIQIVPTDPPARTPHGFDPELLDDARALIREVALGCPAGLAPRVVLTGQNTGVLIEAVRYLAAGLDQPLLRLGEINKRTVDDDEATDKRRMFRALVRGSRRQFTALVPIGHDPFLMRAVAYPTLDLIAEIPSVIFIPTTEPDILAAGALGDALLVLDHRPRVTEPCDLRLAATDEGIAVGDVDWIRVNAEARAKPGMASGLCRLALAVARRRGSTTPVTEDFLGAIAFARRASAPLVGFGRGGV